MSNPLVAPPNFIVACKFLKEFFTPDFTPSEGLSLISKTRSFLIPTTGSMSVLVQGEINGVSVDVEIPIEDVESTAVLDFPPSSSGSSNQDVASLKNAMSALQKDVSNLKSKLGGVDAGTDLNVGSAYDFAIFGLSLGAAGVILAIIAMIKRK